MIASRRQRRTRMPDNPGFIPGKSSRSIIGDGSASGIWPRWGEPARIIREALGIAADICVYTNSTIEVL